MVCTHESVVYNERFGVWQCNGDKKNTDTRKSDDESNCHIAFCRICTQDPSDEDRLYGPKGEHPIYSLLEEDKYLTINELNTKPGICLNCGEYYGFDDDPVTSQIMFIGIGQGGGNVVQTALRYMLANKKNDLAAATLWHSTKQRYLCINSGPEVTKLDKRFFPRKRQTQDQLDNKNNYHTVWLNDMDSIDKLEGAGHKMGMGAQLTNNHMSKISDAILRICKISPDGAHNLPRIIIVINSTGGGTGSGGTPHVIDTIRNMDMESIIINFNILPFANETNWWANSVFSFAKSLQGGYQSYAQRHWTNYQALVGATPREIADKKTNELINMLKKCPKKWYTRNSTATNKFGLDTIEKIYRVLDETTINSLDNGSLNGREKLIESQNKVNSLIAQLSNIGKLGYFKCESCDINWLNIMDALKTTPLYVLEERANIMKQTSDPTKKPPTPLLGQLQLCQDVFCDANHEDNPTFRFRAKDQKIKYIYISNEYFKGAIKNIQDEWTAWQEYIRSLPKKDQIEADMGDESLNYKITNQIIVQVIGNIMLPLIYSTLGNEPKMRIHYEITNTILNDKGIQDYISETYVDKDKWLNNIKNHHDKLKNALQISNITKEDLKESGGTEVTTNIKNLTLKSIIKAIKDLKKDKRIISTDIEHILGNTEEKTIDINDFCTQTDPFLVPVVIRNVPNDIFTLSNDNPQNQSNRLLDMLIHNWNSPVVTAKHVGTHFWISFTGPTMEIFNQRKMAPEVIPPNLYLAYKHWTIFVTRDDFNIGSTTNDSTGTVGGKFKSEIDKLMFPGAIADSFCKAFSYGVSIENQAVILLSESIPVELFKTIQHFDILLPQLRTKGGDRYKIPGYILWAARDYIYDALSGVYHEQTLEALKDTTWRQLNLLADTWLCEYPSGKDRAQIIELINDAPLVNAPNLETYSPQLYSFKTNRDNNQSGGNDSENSD